MDCLFVSRNSLFATGMRSFSRLHTPQPIADQPARRPPAATHQDDASRAPPRSKRATSSGAGRRRLASRFLPSGAPPGRSCWQSRTGFRPKPHLGDRRPTAPACTRTTPRAGTRPQERRRFRPRCRCRPTPCPTLERRLHQRRRCHPRPTADSVNTIQHRRCRPRSLPQRHRAFGSPSGRPPHRRPSPREIPRTRCIISTTTRSTWLRQRIQHTLHLLVLLLSHLRVAPASPRLLLKHPTRAVCVAPLALALARAPGRRHVEAIEVEAEPGVAVGRGSASEIDGPTHPRRRATTTRDPSRRDDRASTAEVEADRHHQQPAQRHTPHRHASASAVLHPKTTSITASICRAIETMGGPRDFAPGVGVDRPRTNEPG